MTKTNHKPTIETIINTAAIALSSFAVYQLTQVNDGLEQWIKALVLLFVAMALEFIKYEGRQKKLW